MAQITGEQSDQQIDALWRAAEDARRAGEPDDAIARYQEILDHPCTPHQVITHEVLDEIHRVLRELGRFDEAIQAKREAITAGYRSSPDPEADIAEILVEAGRHGEADTLYTTLRQRDPDDVWLYNSAGYIYDGVDDRKALGWLLDGIEVALTTGDADQVVGQLLDMTRRQWDRLGEPEDNELIARVESFQQNWVRSPYKPRWADRSREELRRCTYCCFDPVTPLSATPTRPGTTSTPTARPVTKPGDVALSLAWFPEAVGDGHRPLARAHRPVAGGPPCLHPSDRGPTQVDDQAHSGAAAHGFTPQCC